MRVSVQGEVFFARSAQNVFLLQLEGDAITVNTPSLLAFDAHLGYDIRMLAMPGSLPAGCSTSSFRGRAWWPCPPTVRRRPGLLATADLCCPADSDLLVGGPAAADQEHLQDGLPHWTRLRRLLPVGLPRSGLRGGPAQRGPAGDGIVLSERRRRNATDFRVCASLRLHTG